MRYNRDPKTPEREAYAFKRRGEGAAYRQISEELGFKTPERARQLFKAAERKNKNNY